MTPSWAKLSKKEEATVVKARKNIAANIEEGEDLDRESDIEEEENKTLIAMSTLRRGMTKWYYSKWRRCDGTFYETAEARTCRVKI